MEKSQTGHARLSRFSMSLYPVYTGLYSIIESWKIWINGSIRNLVRKELEGTKPDLGYVEDVFAINAL